MEIKNCFFVSNFIFDYQLSSKAFYVYCYLRRCKNQRTSKCFPSGATMAKACGLSESSVRRAIRELEQKELITVTHQFRDSRQLSNSYTFLPLAR